MLLPTSHQYAESWHLGFTGFAANAGAALASGFSKAFATLIDTHVTTVVSCFFLFVFGTPSVKGFATTLVLGLVTNLFTSVFVSRVAFDWELVMQGRTPRLKLGMSG